jgi:enoyl-CoA hydratase
MTAPLIVERVEGAAVLRLNRPDKLNAFNAPLVEGLIEAVDRAVADGVRLIVFRGEGKGFAAGFDVDGLDAASDGDLALRLIRIEILLQRVQYAPVATLALVHGPCFGAAADLVAACRWRVAAPGAKFRMPGLRFGVVLGTRRLAQRVGTDTARTLLESSKVFDHEEALRVGFLTDVTAQEGWPNLIASCASVAATLLPAAQAAMLGGTVPDTRDADLSALTRSVAEPGLKARIAAYVASLKSKAGAPK